MENSEYKHFLRKCLAQYSWRNEHAAKLPKNIEDTFQEQAQDVKRRMSMSQKFGNQKNKTS